MMDPIELLAPSRLWSRDEVLARPCPVPTEPGVYAWYFRQIPPGVPTQGCLRCGPHTLLYLGIAPKVPPTNGAAPSRQRLSHRIRYHYRGNAEGSTLRLTLGCLLADQLGIALQRVESGKRLTFETGEAALSAWMGENAFVTWVVHPSPWELEEHLIGTLFLPLNLDQNDRHPFHALLSKLRGEARVRARALPIFDGTSLTRAAPETKEKGVATPRAHTNWTPLRQHFRDHPVQPGERVRLTRQDLQSILGIQDLPESANRVTLWDPLMGKKGGGLQNVLQKAQLVPVAFEWEGQGDRRPILRCVVLQKWGHGVME